MIQAHHLKKPRSKLSLTPQVKAGSDSKNILITGGAGYIGSHLVDEFSKAGYTTIVYDNLSSSSSLNLASQVKIIKGDITDSKTLISALSQNIHAVVHVAALKSAGESMSRTEDYANINISATIGLINNAIAAGIKNFIFASSAAIYGEPKKPKIDESHPKEPTNFYGETKLVLEQILRWYASSNKINYAALRYFNVVGYNPTNPGLDIEKQPMNLIPVIMEVAHKMRPELEVFGTDYNTKDGTAIRDYIHISDLASAHIKALNLLEQGAKSFSCNLGSGRGLSVLEIIKAVEKYGQLKLPVKYSPRRDGDSESMIADTSLAEKTLGFKPENCDLEYIISSTFSRYKKYFANVSKTRVSNN